VTESYGLWETPLRMLVLWTSVLTGASRDMVVAPGVRIRHDDFQYAVTQFDTTDRIGDVRARGRFVIVTFEVENRARRVAHRWSSTIAYVIDAEGRQFENDAAAQRALDRVTPFGRKDRYVTPAGAVERTKLVFDLPMGVKEPYVKVRGDFLMGDLFDANQFQRMRVRLF
jgi:hypothetical protein